MAFPQTLPQPSFDQRVQFRALVDSLYAPGRPSSQVQEANARLLEHQRSDFAFPLAVDLFASQEPNHRYFAALTVALKSNLSLRSADEETNVWLIRLVLRWFCQAIDEDLQSFVIHRLASTIVTVFLTTGIPWQNCLKDVFVLMSTRDISKTLTHENVDLVQCINSVTDVQMSGVLTTFTTLAEECGRLTHTAQTDHIYTRVATNYGAVIILLENLYQRLRDDDAARGLLPVYSEQVLKCHLQWLKLYKAASPPGSRPEWFSDLIPFAMKLIEILPDGSTSNLAGSTFVAACDLLESTLKDDKVFISDAVDSSFVTFLQRPKASMYLNMEDSHGYEGDVHFNRMVLAYCRRAHRVLFFPKDATSTVLLNEPRYAQTVTMHAYKRNWVMKIIKQITICLFHRTLEQDLVMDVVEYWDDFVQDTRENHLRKLAEGFALEAIDPMCAASTFRFIPDPEEPDYMDDIENEFREEVRERVRDLLQVFCEEYGLPVFRHLLFSADGVWGRIQQNTHKPFVFQELEPPLLFMIELAESLRFSASEDFLSEDEDNALRLLFQSPWFAVILDPTLPVPISLRKLALRAIGEFKMYFGYHEEELWRALNLLIDQMRIQNLAAPAAVSMRNLCDENRGNIAKAGRVEAMLEVCCQYFDFPAAQREPKTAITAAVASVAEAMDRPEDSGAVFKRLLGVMTKDHDRRLRVANQTGNEADDLCRVVCRDSLTLMVGMGRAAQSRDDEDMIGTRLTQVPTKRRKYWTSKKAGDVQRSIAGLLRSCLEASDFSPDIVSLACDVLRSGYRERLPGPFVFEPSVTMDFVGSMPTNVDHAFTLTKLIADFVSSQQPPVGTPDAESLASAITYIFATIDRLEKPREEPELTATCLEVAERLLRCMPAVLASRDEATLHKLVQFSLTCLEVPEPLPTRASAGLWNTLLSVAEDAKFDEQTRTTLTSVINHFGPALTSALVTNFAGGASRNELNKLVDAFRLLVQHFPATKSWLQTAFAENPAFASIPEAERKRFVDSVFMLRGSPKTRQVVTEFWGKAKGTVPGYT